MGTRAGCAAALRLAFGALTHGAGGGSGIQRGGFGGVPAVTGLMRSRGLSSGAPDDPKQPAGGAGSAASPASHGAASTSGQGESATDAQVPGWLKGPKLRQTSTLREEWVEAAHPASGEKCWKSAMTGEYTQPGIPKPPTWHEVVDKSSGLLYYWCPETGETTVIGEPKPGPLGRSPAYMPSPDSRRGDAEQGGKGEKGERLTFVALYNNPLGWVLLGLAAFGIVFQNAKG
mmetsp:Transcript_1757/g.4691  ORF Transcript_1757/g.4691 Transcript_1757/m.4691 type:complete len:231 (-) Transcript_1757:417-1109(-)